MVTYSVSASSSTLRNSGSLLKSRSPSMDASLNGVLRSGTSEWLMRQLENEQFDGRRIPPDLSLQDRYGLATTDRRVPSSSFAAQVRAQKDGNGPYAQLS